LVDSYYLLVIVYWLLIISCQANIGDMSVIEGWE